MATLAVQEVRGVGELLLAKSYFDDPASLIRAADEGANAGLRRRDRRSAWRPTCPQITPIARTVSRPGGLAEVQGVFVEMNVDTRLILAIARLVLQP